MILVNKQLILNKVIKIETGIDIDWNYISITDSRRNVIKLRHMIDTSQLRIISRPVNRLKSTLKLDIIDGVRKICNR